MMPWFFSYVAGGLLLGSGAVLLWITRGKIAGISGILHAPLLAPSSNHFWRVAFILGFATGALTLSLWMAEPQPLRLGAWPTMAAGFAVGLGAYLSNGCTSGHGICGIGRLSKRSFAAVSIFMASGCVAALTRAWLGG